MNLNHLDWPFFEAQHRDLGPAFAQWASSRLGQYETNEGGDGKAAREIFQALGRAGWLTRTLPLDLNAGSGLDIRGVCILREICGHSSAIADVAISEPWLGALPIMLAASHEQKDRYLPRYAKGELLPAFALSEPDAGSDAAAIQTSARRDGNHFVLNGRKTWTSNSGLADLYIVFARLEGDSGNSTISAFVVEADDGGFELEERLDVMPPHTVGTWQLRDCRIPADRLLGTPGQGMKISLTSLELFRPTVGAATLGFARRALFEALHRSVARSAFKKPISEHQLIRAKLADMALNVDASALLVYRAAWQHDVARGDLCRAAAMAKLFSSEAAQDVVDEALQIFGGLGVTRGTPVERLYRHVRAFRIFDGTSEIQKLIIARDLLSDPSSW